MVRAGFSARRRRSASTAGGERVAIRDACAHSGGSAATGSNHRTSFRRRRGLEPVGEAHGRGIRRRSRRHSRDGPRRAPAQGRRATLRGSSAPPQSPGQATAPASAPSPRPAPAAATAPTQPGEGASPLREAWAEGEEERAVPMSRIRQRIAERLVQAQQSMAILTTFNEVDMSAVMDLRARFKESFEKTHGVRLSYMSFFTRACVLALQPIPEINAQIRGADIVYHRHVHMGVAVQTERGLVVPVVKQAESRSFADLEREIARLAQAARENRLSLEELSGGTFTISNGGVFGSLMSTPILNPPQSGILGMHKIEKRPIVVDDQVVIRPMMYLALSYDHRIVDGEQAVTFLVSVKQRLEDPERMLLDV
ncbi:MAG: dihydrolipoyllysine-residue succinyltransferase [Candidatus Eisenbacteria bacterium]|uniref:Dihydrolipoyllysine-residue succinyltransferase n=1 Tax=Eiseniibacteriota bacterium TaxID=2212470 RepID=A0A538U5J2_UNCEI|nr:MAG: dihydrolipoyllysine-residue succinyltransferase [Candidatus Eisenbacteria bacterium]